MDTDKPNTEAEIPVDTTTEIFIKNWGIYEKIIENDNMSHKAGYAKLKEILTDEIQRPFSFIDIACGDAGYSSKVLRDTLVREYIGIDVADEALGYARENFRDSGIDAKFIKADFLDFLHVINGQADVIWVGFSVHHLDTEDKLAFMKDVKKALREGGLFMLYEPILLEGEDRAGYYRRFRKTYDTHWKGLDEEEAETLFEHIRETEKPETTEKWIGLGREAGFGNAGKVFSDKTGLYEIFKYTK